MTNVQEEVDYFGVSEDIAVAKLTVSEDAMIKSAFKDVEMITTPIGEEITGVKLINEQQKIKKNGEQLYDVWLTRAIIIEVGEREVLFEKDIVPFSEEILIYRGYNLIEKVSDNRGFLEEWDDEYSPEYKREVLEVKG